MTTEIANELHKLAEVANRAAAGLDEPVLVTAYVGRLDAQASIAIGLLRRFALDRAAVHIVDRVVGAAPSEEAQHGD